MDRQPNPWVHSELAKPSTGEKVFDALKVFLMGYGAYRLIGDLFSLGSRIAGGLRSRRRPPVHSEDYE